MFWPLSLLKSNPKQKCFTYSEMSKYDGSEYFDTFSIWLAIFGSTKCNMDRKPISSGQDLSLRPL